MKISELGSAGALSGTEVLPIVQSGTTKKVSIDDVVALGGGSQNFQQVTDIGNSTTNNIELLSNESASKTITISDNLNPGSNDQGILMNYNNTKGITQISISNTNDDTADYRQSVISNYISNNLTSESIEASLISISNDIYTFGSIGFTKNNANYGFGLYYGENNIGSCLWLNSLNGGSLIGFEELKISSFYYNGNNNIINKIEAGLYLDFASQQYSLGNINNSLFTILDANSTIKTTYQTNDIGLKLDFSIYKFTFGDWEGVYDSTNLYVDAQQGIIKTSHLGNDIGLSLDFYRSKFTFGGNDGGQGAATLLCDFNTQQTIIGDFFSANSGTYFGVDANNNTLITSDNLIVTGNHSTSQYHLKINVGGTDYLIQLLNP